MSMILGRQHRTAQVDLDSDRTRGLLDFFKEGVYPRGFAATPTP